MGTALHSPGGFKHYRVIEKNAESALITSFVLAAADGRVVYAGRRISRPVDAAQTRSGRRNPQPFRSLKP